MRFAHIADCHIGGWRDPKMQALSVSAFDNAIRKAIESGVDFVLIAGDLFNTSIPSIDKIKSAVTTLKLLKEKDIPAYVIPGSHDFSPSGKTMLDVLEEAELFKNVCRGSIVDGKLKLDFTIDPKTGAKITGLLGKKGMLDRQYYSELLLEDLEKEDGFKIFMFHTAITELKTKELQKMESASVSILPKSFDYYAGGHVHIIRHECFDSRKNVVYPGPPFPNSFSELEKLKTGGMYLYEKGEVMHVPIKLKEVESITLDCAHKIPSNVQKELLDEIDRRDFNDKIVTLRLSGTLEEGRPSDINLKEMFDRIYDKGAYFILKNTNRLHSKEYQDIKVVHETVQEIEDALIEEEWGKLSITGTDKTDEVRLVKQLMTVMSSEKSDGEKSTDYESRITDEAGRLVEHLLGKS